jgi:hypothetical protein
LLRSQTKVSELEKQAKEQFAKYNKVKKALFTLKDTAKG